MTTEKKDEIDQKELEVIAMKNFFAGSGKHLESLKPCDCTGNKCNCGFDVTAAYAAGVAGAAAGDLVGSNE